MPHWVSCRSTFGLLTEKHYLGPLDRGVAWQDEHGAIIVSAPTSRHIPKEWLELARWCLDSDVKNAGSKQWSKFIKELRHYCPKVTTIVSYSDPSRGHSGSLYRACNWWWAPTWHRLRPPPSGNGKWNKSDAAESVKDRWIFAVNPDPNRIEVLQISDKSVLKRHPWAEYKEPGGASFKEFKRTNP